MATYDLIVIGTGPAGQRAAVQAAKIGRQVAAIERGTQVGGVCIHTGTVPSKSLREGVLALVAARQHLTGLGQTSVLRSRAMAAAVSRMGRVIQGQTDIVRDQLERNGVDVLQGSAAFVGPRHVAVTNALGRTEHEASRFVIAVGTRPRRPADVPFDGTRILDPDQLLGLTQLPRSMVLIGGGVVGCEYACIFAQLGVKVTLVDRRNRLLRFVDTEIAESLCFHMRAAGVTLRLGEAIAGWTPREKDVAIALESGKVLTAEVAIYAAGREACTDTLGLDSAGVMTDAQGLVQVDACFRTSAPHVFAAGDVIGFPSLASVSSEQGRIAACHAFDVPVHATTPLFPYGIYTIPEVSMVGPTEEELTERKVPYEVGQAYYREIARGQIMGQADGMLKLLFHRETRELLAVHAIGAGATDLIHVGQAVIGHGGHIDWFIDNAFNYPTLAECYKVAALAGVSRLDRTPAGVA